MSDTQPIKPIITSESLSEALDTISKWDYYDNCQSGDYISENSPGYGPTFRWNSQIILPNGHSPIFHGDISIRRLHFLLKISKKFRQEFHILTETDELRDVIIEGKHFEFSGEIITDTCRMWAGKDTGLGLGALFG